MKDWMKRQISEERVNAWLDRIYCMVLGTCVVCDFITISTFSDLFPGNIYQIFIAVISNVEKTAAIFCVALILLQVWQNKNTIRKIIPSLILFIVIAIYLCNNNGDIYLLVLLLFAASSNGRSLRKIYRTYLGTASVTLTVFFVLSITGLIENLGGNSFGLSYRTDYAAYLLALMIVIALYYEDSEMPEPLQILYPLMTWYVNQIIAAKTATVCMLLLSFGVYWREYRRAGTSKKKGWKKFLFSFLYLPPAVLMRLHNRLVRNVPGNKLHKGLKAIFLWFFTYSFDLYAVIMIILTAIYYQIPADLMNKLYQSLIRTFVIRLLYGNVAFQLYPMTLFGNDIPQRGVGWHQGSYIHFYYVLDSSYIRLLMLYGIYVLMLVLGVATAVQMRLRKRQKYTSLYILSLMALDCTMEQHITQLIYAVPFLMLFANWDLPDHENSEWKIDFHKTGTAIWNYASLFGIIIFFLPLSEGIVNRAYLLGEGICTVSLLITPFSKRILQNRRATITAEIIGLCVLGTSLYSCLHVTTASSQEPVYDATLIIPGTQMEREKNTELLLARVQAGEQYMEEYKDINCIVSGPEAVKIKQIMLEDGIEEERIYLDSSSMNMAQTMSECDELIIENELSQRKVLSVLDLQQARMELEAEEQYDNIRMISAPCPRLQYFAVLLTEQVRFIWEKLSLN